MDRIGRFECSKKHFTQRFRMSVAPNPSSPVPRYTPQLPHPSVGGRSRRGWQGRHRGRRSCILRSRSGRGAFSSPASRRGGYVHPVHSAGTLSLPILSRDVPDRWNWAGCDHIIFNSEKQLRTYLPVLKASGTAKAGLRINPECSTQEGHAIYDPCAPGSRMGIRACDFTDELADLVDGLHFHTLCEERSDKSNT